MPPFPLRVEGLSYLHNHGPSEEIVRVARTTIDQVLQTFMGRSNIVRVREELSDSIRSAVQSILGDQVSISWHTSGEILHAEVTINPAVTLRQSSISPLNVDNIFNAYSDVLNNGYIPDTMLMNPQEYESLGGDLSTIQNQQSASYQPINLAIEETYGFGILSEGQAIGVARNVRIRPNESLRPNPIYTLGDSDPNNYRRELKDPLKYGALPIKNSSCVLTWEVEIDGVIRTLSKELDLRRDVYFNRDVDRNIQDKIVIEASIPTGILQDPEPVKEEVFVLENRLETALKFMTDED